MGAAVVGEHPSSMVVRPRRHRLVPMPPAGEGAPRLEGPSTRHQHPLTRKIAHKSRLPATRKIQLAATPGPRTFGSSKNSSSHPSNRGVADERLNNPIVPRRDHLPPILIS